MAKTDESETGVIRVSTDADLVAVERWLKETGSGFLNNIDLIRDAHRENRLHVLAEMPSNSVIAFCSGWLDILEVHPDHCRRGYGRHLAEQIMHMAETNGFIGLKIECKPHSSVPFWQKMGFEVVKCDGNYIFAVRLFPQSHPLPADKPIVSVTLNVVEALQDGILIRPQCTRAFDVGGGRFQLEDRFAVYAPNGDVKLRLSVGNWAIEKKVKYLKDNGFVPDVPFASATTVSMDG